MNKAIIFCLVFLLLFLFFGGCLEEIENVPDENNEVEESSFNTNNTVHMNAQELINDFKFYYNIKHGSFKYVMGYDSLKDGDTLILTDTISKINYTESILFNATNISFNIENDSNKDYGENSLDILFEGNLTDKYKPGDNVRITVTIKKFSYENETSNINYQIDAFKEGWKEDDFISNQTGFLFMSMFGSFLQVLPESCIEKI